MKKILAILILFFNVCNAQNNTRAIEKIHCGIFKDKPLPVAVKVGYVSHSIECCFVHPGRGILFTFQIDGKMHKTSQNGREENHSTLTPKQIEAIAHYRDYIGSEQTKLLSDMLISHFEADDAPDFTKAYRSEILFFYVQTMELLAIILNNYRI